MTIIQSPSQAQAEDTTQSLSQNLVQNPSRDLGHVRDQDTNQDRSQGLDQDQGLGNVAEIHHILCTAYTIDRIRITSMGITSQRTKLTTTRATSPSVTINEMQIGHLDHLNDQDIFKEEILLQTLKNWTANAS